MAARLLTQLRCVGRVADAGWSPALRATRLQAGCLPAGCQRFVSTLDAAPAPSTSLGGLHHHHMALHGAQAASPRHLAVAAPQPSAGGAKASSRKLRPVVPDPERPKKPLTPWLRFLKDFRAKRSDLKGSPQSVFTAASAQWKAMPEPDKRQWQQPYDVEKKSYETAFKNYVDSGKKAAWERPPDKPKVPMTAFLQFAQEYRSKNTHMKVTESTKVASTVWKQMSPAEKAPYEQRYAEEKQKYAKAMEQYKASGKEEAWKAKVGITVKEVEAAKKKEAAALKTKEAAAKKKALALKRREAAAGAAKKKEAAALKTKEAAAKKKALALKRREAAAKKKELATTKKAATAEKRKLAVAKKKLAAEKKKLAAEKKKKLAAAEKKLSETAGSAAKKPSAGSSAAAAKRQLRPPRGSATGASVVECPGHLVGSLGCELLHEQADGGPEFVTWPGEEWARLRVTMTGHRCCGVRVHMRCVCMAQMGEAMEQYKASGKEEAWKAKVGITVKEAEAAKKTEAAALKKKALVLKKKEAAAKKKELATKKKAATAEKRKLAAAKKKLAAENKKLAVEKKKLVAVEKKLSETVGSTAKKPSAGSSAAAAK
eukprot:CAMPEP_0197942598 /NCGR_PEP_ID=MMETSP1439-20131203/124490_1 /TAXON_ID=66791 /ORGANISM="Gonyaulax spinifera, Strain CCMP409" /LENGTH=598 /DNA_ID=CAMNT_0043565855 /DNA_START=62 /DNA_END=1860 /DNA_ORIENTATION=+